MRPLNRPSRDNTPTVDPAQAKRIGTWRRRALLWGARLEWVISARLLNVCCVDVRTISKRIQPRHRRMLPVLRFDPAFRPAAAGRQI
jgi:hypothetical protein